MEIVERLDTPDTCLLRFLPESDEALRILTINANRYLPELRQRLSKAELHAVTVNEEAPGDETYRGLGVDWQVLDYREIPIPYAKEYFDYVIAPHILEDGAVNPQDIAAGVGTHIRQTGFLLTSFYNMRYGKILQELMEGHFYHFCSHAFTKSEMERLLYASFYKDAVFVPQLGNCADELLERLETCGFENRRQDLDTEVWLVKAARSTPEIAALKSLYTPQVRRQMVTLLRRIEFAIDPAENLAAFWSLYDREHIFPDYLAAFIQETIPHLSAFLPVLLASADENGRSAMADELLQALQDNLMQEKDQMMLQSLARGRMRT